MLNMCVTIVVSLALQRKASRNINNLNMNELNMAVTSVTIKLHCSRQANLTIHIKEADMLNMCVIFVVSLAL